ncbi:hypothetical protein ACN2XU_11870 [Primorskyibacter sp. 2E107]|uniref:hypothetical protein n=1 Tax=Primorskyibacter sp. 2E107 TaxID=3403458 RepID=UPI003AF96C33
MTATRTSSEFRDRQTLPKLRWSKEDLPFCTPAGGSLPSVRRFDPITKRGGCGAADD